MARLSQDQAVVNARIVYWGVEGAGKTTNLLSIHEKLRPDHRGELERVPTRIDPTVEYEIMPIELGEIAGLRTRIQMIAVPGGSVHAPTRKQLLDQVDGLVLVVDSRRERIEENVASLDELRRALADYGQSLDDIPLVLQYNKRDLSDPYAIDELHRRLGLRDSAVFETVATQTSGVLQTLSTLSKRVIRRLREQRFEVTEPAPVASPVASPAAPRVEPPIEPPTETPARSPMPTPVLDEHATRIDMPAPTAPMAAAQRVDDELLTDPEVLLSPAERMEAAILAGDGSLGADGSDPGGSSGPAGTGDFTDEIESLAQQTEVLLDEPWEQLSPVSPLSPLSSAGELEHIDDLDSLDEGVQLGPELSITAVGEATQSGERSVRVPLVLADKQGRRSTLVVTISLDPLLEQKAE